MVEIFGRIALMEAMLKNGSWFLPPVHIRMKVGLLQKLRPVQNLEQKSVHARFVRIQTRGQ